MEPLDPDGPEEPEGEPLLDGNVELDDFDDELLEDFDELLDDELFDELFEDVLFELDGPEDVDEYEGLPLEEGKLVDEELYDGLPDEDGMVKNPDGGPSPQGAFATRSRRATVGPAPVAIRGRVNISASRFGQDDILFEARPQ